ncbi:MAG: phosphate/phosphite/phosphonate ABC transporter substrate-binding protein [Mycolicibacterium sp.]|uniref:phosphate/phosphite/phosphonate ABC transporter substrate-binding protein n=1 Tax=Mycolicibacterium sp. TaxID=2320850 RepID=UPI003D0BC40F
MKPPTSFLVDTNLGLPVDERPWPEILRAAGIVTTSTTDLAELDASIERHEPDFAFTPVPGFHRLLARGDRCYRGLAIVTSKFTGRTHLPSVLVVRNDDPAAAVEDLRGAAYGYINKSCTSSYFSAAILLQKHGERLDEFFDLHPTKPWQGQIEAVKSGAVRATMVPEDVWRSTPANAVDTKVIDRYNNPTGPAIIVRCGLDDAVVKALRDALLEWQPEMSAIYGPFKPFRDADVADFFRDLDCLPVGY